MLSEDHDFTTGYMKPSIFDRIGFEAPIISGKKNISDPIKIKFWFLRLLKISWHFELRVSQDTYKKEKTLCLQS